jgi:hypothetical protein
MSGGSNEVSWLEEDGPAEEEARHSLAGGAVGVGDDDDDEGSGMKGGSKQHI